MRGCKYSKLLFSFIIEQIFDTEIIIEKYPGKEILMENMHQAFAEIGFKIHKATTDEIESALVKCKKK